MFRKDAFVVSAITLVTISITVVRYYDFSGPEINLVGNAIVSAAGIYGTIRITPVSNRKRLYRRSPLSTRFWNAALDAAITFALGLLLVLMGFATGIIIMMSDPEALQGLFHQMINTVIH